jgi:hypothetical protein
MLDRGCAPVMAPAPSASSPASSLGDDLGIPRIRRFPGAECEPVVLSRGAFLRHGGVGAVPSRPVSVGGVLGLLWWPAVRRHPSSVSSVGGSPVSSSPVGRCRSSGWLLTCRDPVGGRGRGRWRW